MKKTYYLILIVLLVSLKTTSAQFINETFNGADQLSIGPLSNTYNYFPLSNYHFFNPFYYNPAMAGIGGKKQINADWNRQYNHAFLVSYEQPIASMNSAIGMNFLYTSDFFTSIRHFGLAYNYGFQLDDKAVLKLGAQFSQTSMLINNYFTNYEKKWVNAPSMDFGLVFQQQQFRLGISIQNIFPAKIILGQDISSSFEIEHGQRQINFSVANTFKLSKKWNLSLAALLRNSDSFNIYDFSSYISFRKKLFLGTTYRTEVDNRWIIFLGLKIKEKVNLQFSFNTKKERYEDHRFFEFLTQYEF